MSTNLTALYYPHIVIENEKFLKNALLIWDQVELICPFNGFPYTPNDPSLLAAFAILARPLQPSQKEKQDAHEAIIEIANANLPQWLFPQHTNKNLHYKVYPEKFLPETWDALQRTKLAQPIMSDIEPPTPMGTIRLIREKEKQKAYETTQAFGLTMMSILADCCSGGRKQLVTDEIDSYVALDSYLKLIAGAKPEKKKNAEHERLVTISLNTADLSHISLKSIVDMREKEREQPKIRAMRHSYVQKLNLYITRLTTEARSTRDVAEIERVFAQEVSDDIGLLKEELKDEAKKIIFSKELGTAAVALAGTFVEPITSNLIAAGALYRAKVEFQAARNKTLKNHSMSWLYEMNRLKLY